MKKRNETKRSDVLESEIQLNIQINFMITHTIYSISIFSTLSLSRYCCCTSIPIFILFPIESAILFSFKKQFQYLFNVYTLYSIQCTRPIGNSTVRFVRASSESSFYSKLFFINFIIKHLFIIPSD